LFTRHNVFTEAELRSRYEILLESYCKTLNIEALTMVDIVMSDICPACVGYQNELAALCAVKQVLGDFDSSLEGSLLARISTLSGALLTKLNALENAMKKTDKAKDILAQACYYRDKIFPAMEDLRCVVDDLETLVARKHWPLPSYAELLFSVL